MCILYKLSNSAAEIARLFDAKDRTEGANRADRVYPGQPGLVVTEEEGRAEDGSATTKREVRQMSWGFPLVLKSKRTGEPLKPKPVNIAREDKLDSFFWRDSWQNRRCLIPLNAFAEFEGPKGAKTHVWFGMNDTPVFACAGVWRQSEEWGAVYAMIITDANEVVASVHDRMPMVVGKRGMEG